MIHIYPSLISGDLLALRDQIKSLDPYCAGYHLDLMDGHFVPNITWGPAFINTIAQSTQRQLWVHMMVTDPELWISRLQVPAKSMIDFHIEIEVDHKKIISEIKKRGMCPGLALKPQTPLHKVEPFLHLIDYVLVMSVEPGFSGQQFIPASLEKIKALTTIKVTKHYSFSLAADGGIDATNIQKIAEAGAEYLATASAIFSSKNPVKALTNLKK